MNEHQSRFKAYLLPRSAWADEALRLQPTLQEFERVRGEMSPAEQILVFIFIYAQARRPGAWAMSRGRTGPVKTGSDFLFSKLSANFDFLKKLQVKTFNEFVLHYNLKKLPAAILLILEEWQNTRCTLVLHSEPVTPLEMLRLQARGERAVTLDLKAALAGAAVDGARDALEFLLHDLAHADLYFHSHHADQRRFFEAFLKVMEAGVLAADLARDPELERDVNYLISDMNSHRLHLIAHLKAALVKSELLRVGLGPRGILSTGEREALNHRLIQLQLIAGFDDSLVTQDTSFAAVVPLS